MKNIFITCNDRLAGLEQIIAALRIGRRSRGPGVPRVPML